jgi:hypothetical protein
MALRAKELSNTGMRTLRIMHGVGDAPSTAIADVMHMNRGDLVEAILAEEFEEKAKAISNKD